MANIRIGHGYDVHRLMPGRKLVLGGVDIEHHMGLDGHSDADVLCHAIMDSLLGATAMGDIGMHFPPDDPVFEDASSIGLLDRVARLVDDEGWAVSNVDATVIAEQPKISGHVPKMRQLIAEALGVEMDAVSIKATTEEGLGFTGAGHGIAAHCVALMEKK